MMGRCPFSHTQSDAREPAQPGRRGVLLGLASGALGLGLSRPASAATAVESAQEREADRQPFHGPYQAGVVTPQQASALVVAFDVLAESRGDLERLLRILTDRIAFLMHGGPAPERDPRYPPLDSGILGPKVSPNNLTVTVAVGASLFDGRYGLSKVAPMHLVAMDQFPNDAFEPGLHQGDLALQFCANSPETNIHALRDILKHTPDLMTPRWKIDGFLPQRALNVGSGETGRNLLGFKDGTANLDVNDAKLMDERVWVQPGAGEPSWAQGGSYQVIRIIRMFVERWDRTALIEQETIIGRDKTEGAPLGRAKENDDPDYADDPKGKRIPLTAHVRLANPRTAQTDANRILRRGYNYSRGLSKSGQFDMGLLFVCFQSDLGAGFMAVQNRLNGEPLEEYIKPIGGGYFFVLPGVTSATSFLGETMLLAA